MKRYISVSVFTCMALSIAACGGTETSVTQDSALPEPTANQSTSPTAADSPAASSDPSPEESTQPEPISAANQVKLTEILTTEESPADFFATSTTTIREIAEASPLAEAELTSVADTWEKVAKKEKEHAKFADALESGTAKVTTKRVTNSFQYTSVEGPCAVSDLVTLLDEIIPQEDGSWVETAADLPGNLSDSVVLREPWLCDVQFAKGYPKFYTRELVANRQDKLTNWKAEGRLLTSARQALEGSLFVALDKRLYTSLDISDTTYEPFWDNVRAKPWYGTCAAMDEFTSEFRMNMAPMESLCNFSDFR